MAKRRDGGRPVAARVVQRLKRVLLNLPVTMLVFLARTAIAQFVAAQLLLVAYRHGRQGNIRLGALLLGNFQAWGLGVLELHACSQGFGFLPQPVFFFDRFFAATLTMGHTADGVAMSRIQKPGKTV